MNRLENEKSPYLLQHAENPVDWFPWGKEAFDQAKSQDRPVFLSIGYSTCHWCHVMAHESFEDLEVADVLNRYYVCIKVDREERPDIDSVYMSVCQALTGSGGWPLTILMTPEQKPFWAGTYLPKTAFGGMMGLLELLETIRRQWNGNRGKLTEASEETVAYLHSQSLTVTDCSHSPDKETLYSALNLFLNVYDRQWGGFGSAPKFPTPHNLLFLLRYSVLEKDKPSLLMATHTLTQMARGGLFDQIGGGFSRYSTDRRWLVPHFEKMLYDNALLSLAYLDAFSITSETFFRFTAERTLDYVLRELTDQQGGFYCGQDADSQGMEGKYYVFTPEEICKVLGEQSGETFCQWFNITDKGNFEGKSIPNLLDNPRYDEHSEEIDLLCKRLYDYRLARTFLHKDDKVLTSWNGLMISAMAKAAWLLNRNDYLQAASKAQRFLKENLFDNQGRLLLRWREGQSAHPGQLDDYAFYAYALLELYHTTLEILYLKQAADIADQLLDLFSDHEKGGFYLCTKDSERLISRPKETYDGALPSGNSVAALVLQQLSLLTGETRWQWAARTQLSFVAGAMKEYPAGHSMALLALTEALYPSRELVCVTSEGAVPLKLMEYLQKNRIANLFVLLKTQENQDLLSEIAPFTAAYPIPQAGELYYLCQNGACFPPVRTLSELQKLLKE